MGCLCSKNNPNNLLTKGSQDSSFLLSMTFTGLNHEQIAKRFANQIDKVKEIRAELQKNLEQAGNAKKKFYSSLERLDLYFSKKIQDDRFNSSDIVECPHCFRIFNDLDAKPLTLPCDHSICYTCANKLYNDYKFIKCQSDNTISSLSPDEYEVNTKLLELVECINKNLYCSIHIKQGVSFCSTCKKIICEECASQHTNHFIRNINDEQINEDAEIWEKNLDLYRKKLDQGKKQLESYEESVRTVEKTLEKCINDHIEKVKANKIKVMESIEKASDTHIQDMTDLLKKFVENLPESNIKLYEESIGNEIEKTDNKIKEFKNLTIGEKLFQISAVDFRTQINISKPDLASWEITSSAISDIQDLEAFVLALGCTA